MNLRIADKNRLNLLLQGLQSHQQSYLRYSQQLSTGVRVENPGDDPNFSLISFNELKLADTDSFKKRISFLKGYFDFLDENLNQANNVLIRAKEIAQQAANETYSPEMRERLSHEVFQLRDHLVRLANATYQGRYVWGGSADDNPPVDLSSYTVPSSGPASQRYVFDSEPGRDVFRQVQVSPDFTVQMNDSGFETFARAIGALERLGRALAGYSTNPPTGLPNGTGSAYNFPNDFSNQTAAIRNALDLLEDARANDIGNQRTIIASRLTRLDISMQILRLDQGAAEDYLAKVRDVDVAEAATKLKLTETFLQATYQVISRVSRLNLLDYI